MGISHCIHVNLLGLQRVHIDVVQIAIVPHPHNQSDTVAREQAALQISSKRPLTLNKIN